MAEIRRILEVRPAAGAACWPSPGRRVWPHRTGGGGAGRAPSRGFTVLRTAAIPGQSAALVWARLLTDAGAPDDLASRVINGADPSGRWTALPGRLVTGIADCW